MTRFRGSAAEPGFAKVRGRLASCDWPLAGGIVAGTLLDAAFGDPRRGHPVAAFGRAAQALQDRMYRDDVVRGAEYTAVCVLAAGMPAVLVQYLMRRHPWLRLVATAGAVWTVTGAASLASEAERIRRALEAGDVELARAALPSLCGRDPRGLDEPELVRAVIESVAENSSDAVLAPLLWGAIGGLPGLLVYRAVNTLDAMVGYRSARYARFGWASARLDDVMNWLPARLTGLLASGLARVAGGRPLSGWHAMRVYGSCHPSPNAGHCEAAFAGALGVRLGGTNAYGGVVETRQPLGDGRAPVTADIARAVRMCRATAAAGAVGAAAAAMRAERSERAAMRPRR